MKTVFITGIDTDAGKSVATAMIAKYLRSVGVNAITQKLIQTGCVGVSEDIITHRKLMGIDLQPVDSDGTTCPIVFTYPCSPHLAAEIDKRSVDICWIKKSTAVLCQLYDKVLIEGAGGLMVPLTRDYYTIDYIVDNKLPIILVVSNKLGSINHALLNLELIWAQNIEIVGIVYNHFIEGNEQISADTKVVLTDFIKQRGKSVPIVEMGSVDKTTVVDFSKFF